MSELKHTQRGFAYIEFRDHYDNKCSLQKSSLATEDAIWFGIDDANPQVLHGDARRLGIATNATSGWVPYPLPSEVSLSTRMHLTQDQVRELLPTLIHFAETSDVLAPADCRTQPAPALPVKTWQERVSESSRTDRFKVGDCMTDEIAELRAALAATAAPVLSNISAGLSIPDAKDFDPVGLNPYVVQEADAIPKISLSDDQLDKIARSYFAEEWAQNHLKNAIHDAFITARSQP